MIDKNLLIDLIKDDEDVRAELKRIAYERYLKFTVPILIVDCVTFFIVLATIIWLLGKGL